MNRFSEKKGPSSHSVDWLIAAMVTATICKICLAFFTYGTNDASMWDSSAQLIRQSSSRDIYTNLVDVRDPEGKFLHQQIFNHPPLMIYLLSGLNRVTDATGAPVHTSLRLLSTVADVGTVGLTAALLRNLCSAFRLWPMVLITMAPS